MEVNSNYNLLSSSGSYHSPAWPTSKSNNLHVFLKNLFSDDFKSPFHSSKKHPIEDVPMSMLEKEIDHLENGIDQETEELKSDLNGREAAKAIVDVKNWASRHVNNTNKAVQNGMIFLEKVLPPSLLKNDILKIHFKATGIITNSSTVLLGALDVGINGLALMNKEKILLHSKELLKQLKKENEKKMALLKSAPSTSDPNTKSQLNKIQKILLEWQVRLTQEEESLANEKRNITESMIATFLGTACLVLGLIPDKTLASLLGKIAAVVAIPANFLGLRAAYREMKASKNNFVTLMDWAIAFRERQKYRHHLSEKTDKQIAGLLAKREALAKAKIVKLEAQFQTLEPEIKALKQKQFDHLVKESTVGKDFETWYRAHSKEELLQFYIDHQETIELTVKNALRQMVNKKHAVESGLLDFKHLASTANFTAAGLAFTISAILAFIGLLTTPLAGAGFVLIGVSVACSLIGLGLTLEGYRRAYIVKPASTLTIFKEGIEFRMAWAKLRSNLYSYRQSAKKEALTKKAISLYSLQDIGVEKDHPEYLKALDAYKRAKANFENNQMKIDEWDKRLKELQNIMTQKGWEDFARHASLDSTSFDALQAFASAFQNCDLTLLSKETKALLESQIGIDLADLEEQRKKNPDLIKNTLQNFFAMNDSQLVGFMQIQNARMAAGLLGSVQ